MCFLGSGKYPDEAEYKQFLAKHGGRSNAATSTESTTYHFSVHAAHLPGALDRFAQFFQAPLFEPTAAEREMRAVDAEHRKNFQSHARRRFQLAKQLADPAHRFNSFGTGSLETLQREDIRSKLVEFWGRHYRGGAITLAVLGAEKLQELVAMVRGSFGSVRPSVEPAAVHPLSGVVRELFDGSAFAPVMVGARRLVRWVPVADQRVVELIFPVPSTDLEYLCKPHDFWSHCIGHEADGSILAALKRRNLATSLMAGRQYEYSAAATFAVTVSVTPEGFDRWREVAAIVLQYIGVARAQPPCERVWREMQAVAAMNFAWQEQSSPVRACQSLVAHLACLPAGPHLLAGRSLYFQWSPEAVARFGSFLAEPRCQIQLCARDLAPLCRLKEPVYGTAYSVDQFEPIEEVQLEPGELHLPGPNPFIATDFAIHNVQAGPQPDPVTPSCALWRSHAPNALPESATVRTAPRMTPTDVDKGVFWWLTGADSTQRTLQVA